MQPNMHNNYCGYKTTLAVHTVTRNGWYVPHSREGDYQTIFKLLLILLPVISFFARQVTDKSSRISA